MNPFTIKTRSRTDFVNIDRIVAEAVRETGLTDGLAYRCWRVLIRYVAPVAVAVTFIANLI